MVLFSFLFATWNMTDNQILEKAQEVFGLTFSNEYLKPDTYFILSQSLQDPKEIAFLTIKGASLKDEAALEYLRFIFDQPALEINKENFNKFFYEFEQKLVSGQNKKEQLDINPQTMTSPSYSPLLKRETKIETRKIRNLKTSSGKLKH